MARAGNVTVNLVRPELPLPMRLRLRVEQVALREGQDTLELEVCPPLGHDRWAGDPTGPDGLLKLNVQDASAFAPGMILDVELRRADANVREPREVQVGEYLQLLAAPGTPQELCLVSAYGVEQKTRAQAAVMFRPPPELPPVARPGVRFTRLVTEEGWECRVGLKHRDPLQGGRSFGNAPKEAKDDLLVVRWPAHTLVAYPPEVVPMPGCEVALEREPAGVPVLRDGVGVRKVELPDNRERLAVKVGDTLELVSGVGMQEYVMQARVERQEGMLRVEFRRPPETVLPRTFERLRLARGSFARPPWTCQLADDEAEGAPLPLPYTWTDAADPMTLELKWTEGALEAVQPLGIMHDSPPDRPTP